MPALALVPPPPVPPMTLDQFLAWENEQEERHEFMEGEIFVMSGASKRHAILCSNLMFLLHTQLRPRGCLVLSQSIKVVAGQDSFYPDVVVTCDERERHEYVLEHPSLIIEVLSPSTSSRDRGKKGEKYRAKLPSLQAYLLVDQELARVDVFRRDSLRHDSQGWRSSRHEGGEAVIELASPACRLTLAAIYDNVPVRAEE